MKLGNTQSIYLRIVMNSVKDNVSIDLIHVSLGYLHDEVPRVLSMNIPDLETIEA